MDTWDPIASPANIVKVAQSPVGAGAGPDSYMTTYSVGASPTTVFATGSMQFLWGLDDFSIDSRPSLRCDPAEQIARNVVTHFLTGVP